MIEIVVITAQDIAEMTIEAMLEALLAQLPQATRDLLKLGPAGDEEGKRGCRLCDSIEATIDRNSVRQTLAARALLDYHDIEGSSGPNCFRRCCQIYRAAGWSQ